MMNTCEGCEPSPSSYKKQLLAELARQRRCSVPYGYRGIGEYHGGAYECDHVSPYTKSAGNVDARMMLLLQDWCSHEFLEGALEPALIELGHLPTLPTNRNLKLLLAEHLNLELADTFATNLFPFIKPGKMTSSVPAKDLATAARDYAIPQIRIVAPTIVVCLGKAVWDAIRRALEMKPSPSLAQAIESPFALDDIEVWAQSHPGGLGRARRNRGGKDRVSRDWAQMARAFQNLEKSQG